MKKYEGLHFYINIPNLNDVVADEEARTGKVNHSVHALDTYFSMIEAFGKSHFDTFVVEKITGSRLHMYVVDDLNNAFEVVSEVSRFAHKLTAYLNNEIPKYKNLKNFSIQIGACYGEFYDFKFSHDGMEEETTIGYAANYAAKLQGLTVPTYISVSSDIYESLDSEYQKSFTIRRSSKIEKYEQQYFATALVSKLKSKIDFTHDLEKTTQYANGVNLGDINFSEVRTSVNFNNLSKTNAKKVTGIPFFADIRDFTTQFKEDDSNLEEMADTTQDVLSTMYSTVRKYRGIHVQFQGDREMALFHNYPDYDCVLDAVQAGLRLIDAVKPLSVSVGIGQSLGTLFAAKIGARGEKDNILLGSTVTEADRYEDEKAGKNQLVISTQIYEKLRELRPTWAKQFSKVDDGCYRITIGYTGLVEAVSHSHLNANNQKNNYNKAWGEW